MAFGRGHATFTIDTLKLQKDSLPAAVNEPPPVFPELHQKVHPLNENPSNEYDYKLKLKINFISNFRNFHDTKTNNENLLDRWTEEWSLLPKELKVFSRRKKTKISTAKPNLKPKKIKKKTLNIDLNGFEEKPNAEENDEDEGEEKVEQNDEIDIDDDDKPKDAEKKRITDNENEVDAEVDVEEEDMDADEAADYTYSYFDAGDGYEDDDGDDDGDGGD